VWSRESANAKMDGEANTALFAALSEHGDPNAQKGAIASTRASATWSLDSANVLQVATTIFFLISGNLIKYRLHW
jgi:hypothetical protein